ncbi:MAG: DUF4932 domain-containing protein [Bacteroidota bacterium]
MKRILKTLGLIFGILFLIIGLLALGYFINPNAVEEQALELLYPKVKNEANFQEAIQVEIPEVYELMWIACSLTEAFEKDDNLTTKNDRFKAYHEAVETQFGAYRSHPLIQELQKFLADGNYDMDHHAIRFLSLNYELDEQGRLRNKGDYRIPGLLSQIFKQQYFLIPVNKKLISDFSQKTNFKSFYASQKPLYDQLIQNYHELGDLNDMLTWLEARYPNRISSYRILCSPMTGGFHNTMGFDGVSKGFHQALMFVSAPPKHIGAMRDSVRVRVKSGYSRIVFTEIDHNYVNPFADQYRDQILQAMPDYKVWNADKQGYTSSMNTFLEYMTWGMYSLFAQEQFSGWEYDYAVSRVEDMMDDYRGFYRFSSFNQELIEYYNQNKTALDMHQLYEHMLQWMENNQQASLITD